MAPTEEMLNIAIKYSPHAVCLVPENREERTTEGGLDVAGKLDSLRPIVQRLNQEGRKVSLFIEADFNQLDAAKLLEAPVVEIHTGRYVELSGELRSQELIRIKQAAEYATSIGLEVHAGHGLTYDTVGPISEIINLTELNIGHFIVGEALMEGLYKSIKRMRLLIDESRSAIAESV